MLHIPILSAPLHKETDNYDSVRREVVPNKRGINKKEVSIRINTGGEQVKTKAFTPSF